MRSSASFSIRSFGWQCCAIALLLLTGCFHEASSPAALSLEREWRIVVLPIENLSEQGAPLVQIEQALTESLRLLGMQPIVGLPLEAFMERHRVRYTGGIDESLAVAAQAELAADALLITTVESYAPTPTPQVGLFCRLVSTGEAPTILWAESLGMAGDAAPGLLGLGLINDFDQLLGQATGRMAQSLLHNLAGDADPSSKDVDLFPPINTFRSPVLGTDLRLVTVGFAQGRGSVVEGGTHNAEVVLNHPVPHEVRVAWSIVGGSALGDGMDYQAAGGVLRFPPGETRRTLTVVTRDDALHEGDETLLIRLAVPVGALLGESEQRVTLLDNDPPPRVQFLLDGQTVGHDAGTLDVVVELSSPAGLDIEVPFSLSGDARKDVVYRLTTASPLVIRAGERQAVIRLVVADSGPSRADALVALQLGDPRNALLGKQSTHLLTVRGHGWKMAPSIAVMPFLNETRRKNAGTLVSLHLLTALQKSGRFRVVEPGIVRDRFLNFRLIRPEGISSTDAEALARNMESDLLLFGRVLDYQETGSEPRVGFSAALIERESRKVIWSASSEGAGRDPATLFELGTIRTTNDLASHLAASLIQALFTK